MKALVGAFNQEKALVGAFSVIVKIGCGTDGSFYSTSPDTCPITDVAAHILTLFLTSQSKTSAECDHRFLLCRGLH